MIFFKTTHCALRAHGNMASMNFTNGRGGDIVIPSTGSPWALRNKDVFFIGFGPGPSSSSSRFLNSASTGRSNSPLTSLRLSAIMARGKAKAGSKAAISRTPSLPLPPAKTALGRHLRGLEATPATQDGGGRARSRSPAGREHGSDVDELAAAFVRDFGSALYEGNPLMDFAAKQMAERQIIDVTDSLRKKKEYQGWFGFSMMQSMLVSALRNGNIKFVCEHAVNNETTATLLHICRELASESDIFFDDIDGNSDGIESFSDQEQAPVIASTLPSSSVAIPDIFSCGRDFPFVMEKIFWRSDGCGSERACIAYGSKPMQAEAVASRQFTNILVIKFPYERPTTERYDVTRLLFCVFMGS